MNQLEDILNRLSKVKRIKGGYSARCPSHYDKTNSLTIKEEDGKILLYCFANCSTQNVVKAIGLNMSNLFTDKEKKDKEVSFEKNKSELNDEPLKKYKSIDDICKSFHTIEDFYPYNWEGEEPSIVQIRYLLPNNKKAFATFHKEEDYWVVGKPEGLTPLYNLQGVINSKSVLIVEGEKLVDIITERFGLTATTSLGGAKGAAKTDWSPLINKPSVVIWRDNDEAGLSYQNDIIGILKNLGVQVRIVDVSKLDLENGDDIEQFINKHSELTDNEIKEKILACIPRINNNQPVNYLNEYLNKVRNGDIKNLEIPGFPMLTEFGQCFQPNNQVLLYSQPGLGKTIFSGRIADEWAMSGHVRVKRLLLESPIAFHLQRSLAQIANDTRVLKPKFHFDNPEESKIIVDTHTDLINIVGNTMTTSDTGIKRKVTEWDLISVVNWIKANAKDNDILVIDPISRILNEAPYITTNKLTAEVEAIISENPHLCILWIHHPDNEGNISGGKGWNRFSSSVLNITALGDGDEEELYEVMTMDGDVITMPVSRCIKIAKSRNGHGMGSKIAVRLNPDNLCFEELGKIIKKVK